ncbi:MAG: outer membrane protein transport protein [Deltaproteobacteria bacterium]|nr:outer membrane protein transport protein [Deltaproteobacteria bacterium]
MKQRLFAVWLLAATLTPALASANPEPTAYDSRSIAMGLTGTSYLERPAALVLNPANLEGIDKLGFTFNFTALLVKQWAPVQGPNTRIDSGLGFGPLPAVFIAGRIAPRVVFGAGIYIETGYGSSFDDVICVDGDEVEETPPGSGNFIPDTNPTTCTNGNAPPNGIGEGPQDLNVTFFVGEFSAGTSIRVTDEFWLGVALRLPFSKQVADLWQNVGAVFGQTAYGRVKNDLGGVGFPSPRFGITWKPHRKVTVGAMYRMYSKIRLTGTTDTSTIPNITFNASADWFIPHAIQAGLAYQVNERLLLVFEARAQFHAADKSGNKNQTVTASDPNGPLEITIVVPFGWVTAWSVKVGAEYRFPIDLLAIRGGVNFARSATSGEWAQYFTPPPGLSGFFSAGLGFYWDDASGEQKDKYMLDVTGAFSVSAGSIGDEYIGNQGTIPGTSDQVTLCSFQQAVRTGCPGDLGVFTYWATVGFTVQY